MNNKFSLKTLIFPTIILLVFILVGHFAQRFIRQNVNEHASQSFEADSKEITLLINERLDNYNQALVGLRGLYSASKSVERSEFFAYSNDLNINYYYPGLSALEYLQLVPAKDKNSFIENIKKDTSINLLGYPDFTIYPASDNSENLVVTYTYPEADNYKSLGFDFYSDATRKKIAEMARDNNDLYYTPKVLLQPDNAPGFLGILPIYKNNAPIVTLLEKQTNLLGFVRITVKIDNFFNNIVSNVDPDYSDLKFKVYDTELRASPSEENLLYSSSTVATTEVLKQNRTDTLKIGGRDWVIQYNSPIDYNLSNIEKISPTITLVAVLILGVFVFWLLIIFSNSSRRAMNLAKEMTAKLSISEGKLNGMLAAVKDPFIMMDEFGKIEFWNQASEKMFMYKSQEVMGKPLHDIIPLDLNRNKYKQDMGQFAKTGKNWVVGGTFELPVKDKTGRKFFIELSVSSMKLDEKWHAIGTMRDVTKKKEYSEELKNRTEELERMNKLMVGRELKMMELKKEIERLKQKNQERRT